MASSTDTIGALARSVNDVATVLDIMAGPDQLDSTTIERQPDYTQTSLKSLQGVKVGLIKEYMGEGLSQDVRQVIEAAVDQLKAAGAIMTEVSLPSLDLSLAVYYILCPAEVSSNLSRYDGQRFGYSYADAKNLDQSFNLSRGRGFGKEAKRRIMIGTYVLSSGYYDAYYKQAQTVRTKLINQFEAAMKSVDFMLGPVAPTTAFKIGQNVNNPLEMYLCDIMTVAVNMIGNPAISLPAGSSHNLPVGLQLLAGKGQDKELLSLARLVEEILT
jgi:aspartyl-tRNA(Asn)/glutamyl-tRNA(Gln) amidotransferase subunit A